MKNFYRNLKLNLILILAICSFNILAQSPFYFDPQAVDATLGPNETATVTSKIYNDTEDTIEFSFPGYITRDQGGPDSYGYSWIDSDEDGGPEWGWTDISETGIQVDGLGDDEVAGPFEMGITFPYYGQEKHHFWISANGVVSFNDQFIPYVNDSIPTNSDYKDFIAWFWDDLKVDSGFSAVYYQNYDEKTVVQFDHMVHYPGSESFITGQVIMVTNGKIFLRYRLISADFEKTSATIGIQSIHPEIGLQVAYNQEYVHSEMAVRFDLNRTFITSVTPSSGYLPPNSHETVHVTYSSEGFEAGTYEQELKCVSNIGEYPTAFLHNVMHVTNPEQAGFEGYVTDAVTGYGINDVKVQVGEHYVYTTDNGHYELPLEQGTYNVNFSREGYQTLVVEDTTALPGFSILDVTLEPNTTYLLSGRVYAGDNYIETGFAYGYKLVEETVVDVFADMVGEEGWYEFPGLAAGHYIVKAEPSPNSIYYGDYLPTYYGDVLHWEDATIIQLNNNTDGKHIHLIPVDSTMQGPCSISGTVQGELRTADVTVILKNNDALSAMMIQTAADGSYIFSNLPYGSYDIFAEITGKSITPQTIDLTEANSVVEGVDMMILTDEIVFLGIEESNVFENSPYIYPNPVKDNLHITVNLKKASVLNIDVIDQVGKVVYHNNMMINGHENISFNFTDLPGGIYLIKLWADNEFVVKKFIKD